MSEGSLVVPLDQYEAVGLIGSKAAGLQRLMRDGQRVPPGFVVTTAAYRRAARAVAADRQDSADAWTLPPALGGAIATAYERLAEPSAAGQPAVAVRSSATLEDLPDAAFAGLYATGTGIRGVEEVLSWVRRCWASLYDPAAVAYRNEHGFAEARAAMAVIVQRLIPAEVAGVAFTVDPVSGQRDRVVLNAAWGLGASVVDGLVEPDTFVVERNGPRIVSRSIGDKATRAGTTPDDPREAVPVEQRRQPTLDDPTIIAIAELALRAEVLWEQPVDIEWALADGQVWLLQSRPATGITGAVPTGTQQGTAAGDEAPPFEVVWPTSEAAKYHWKLSQRQGPPEAWRPLEQDISSRFGRGRLHSARIKGQESYDETIWVQGYRYSRTVKNTESQEERTRREREFQAAVDACTERGDNYYQAIVEPEVLARNAKLDAVDLAALAPAELADHLAKTAAMLERHWTLHWLGVSESVIQLLGDRFAAIYKELTGDEGEEIPKKLLAGIPNKFTETVDGLIALARTLQAASALRQAIESEQPTNFLARLPVLPDSDRFREQFDAFLARWGLRSGMGFGTNRSPDLVCWREDPSLVIAILRHYIAQDLERITAPQRRTADERAALLAKTMDAIGADPARRERFTFWYAAAQRAARNFEDHNYDIDSVSYALVHLAVVACGERLTAAGSLADSQDIWMLHLAEIGTALRELARLPAEQRDWQTVVAARREEHRRQQTLRPPPTIGAPPPAEDKQETRPEQQDEAEQPTLTSEEEARLLVRGQAGSAGVATGRVRLIPRTVTVPDVAPGEILVSNNAGPIWTPVFPTVAAIVLDEGALFQHAMGAAREYGIPGVLQTKEATAVLQEGQLITVDGNRGLVLRPE